MAAEDRTYPPESPCDNVCIMDRGLGLCVGCLRTLDEIGAWNEMSPEDQWDVMDAIEQRRAKLDIDGTRPQ